MVSGAARLHMPLLVNPDYRPLYAEAKLGRCIHCGNWRGQHRGRSINDDEMYCVLYQLTSTSFTRPEIPIYCDNKGRDASPVLPEFVTVESRTGTAARGWCNDCDFGSNWVSPREAFDWAYTHVEDRHHIAPGTPTEKP
jgi:hypothetical protein